MTRWEIIDEMITKKVDILKDEVQNYIEELLEKIEDLEKENEDLKDTIFDLTEQGGL